MRLAAACAVTLALAGGAVAGPDLARGQDSSQQKATGADAGVPSSPAAGEDPSGSGAQLAEAPAEAVAEQPVPAAAAPSQPPLRLTGYVDIGFARAEGNGSSFAASDTRFPADYGADPFATMVNSRGDVASVDSGGRFTNGFLPRSVGIGGRPSFLLNTVDLDVRYVPQSAPIFFFARAQYLPRFSSSGEASRLLVEQAFVRVSPFSTQEFAVTVGKFDSVFGIEYLDNEANLRTGITPSLLARYTTGQSLGAKAFYRLQVPALLAALSLNLAATTSGTMIESLQTPDASLTGVPVGSGRLGLEFNLSALELKLGASGMYGPRNDQHQSSVRQQAMGADFRLVLGGLSAWAEYVVVDEDEGAADKITPLGRQTFVSGFHARGGWAQLAYGLPLEIGPLHRVTAYGRYARRHAWFEGFTPLTVDAITAGLRFDLLEGIALKGEAIVNRELEGEPNVPNNVYTSSLVYSW